MSDEPRSAAPDGAAPAAAKPRWQKSLILGLAVVVVASVGWRVARGGSEERSSTGTPEGASSLTGVSSQTTETGEAKEPDTIDKVLPYITEGGLAMILGLFLGMATRGFLKLGVFLGVAAFVALQYLNYKGILTVDWSALKDYVLNITKNADVGTIVKEKLASGGAFGVGYLLGLKRG